MVKIIYQAAVKRLETAKNMAKIVNFNYLWLELLEKRKKSSKQMFTLRETDYRGRAGEASPLVQLFYI